MKTRVRKPLFERLRNGLSEGIAHAKGEKTLRTVTNAEHYHIERNCQGLVNEIPDFPDHSGDQNC